MSLVLQWNGILVKTFVFGERDTGVLIMESDSIEQKLNCIYLALCTIRLYDFLVRKMIVIVIPPIIVIWYLMFLTPGRFHFGDLPTFKPPWK